MPYRCRWRSRQVPFGVAGVADSLRSGHDLPAPRPGIDTPSSSSPRPTSRPAHGSSWELRVAERPQVHTLTPAAGKRRPQRHTITVIGYRASRRCRLVARPPAARSSTTYQITPAQGEEQPAQPRETPALAPPPRTQGGERAHRQPDRRRQLKRRDACGNHPSTLPSRAG
jgi:hypothetical protein